MFFNQNPRGQRFRRITGQHRHLCRKDRRAFIQPGGDEVHRAAMHRRAIGQRAGVGVEALVQRSSDGWMLIIRPAQCSVNSGVRMRMKPARQTISTSQLSNMRVITSSNASRLGNWLCASEAVARP